MFQNFDRKIVKKNKNRVTLKVLLNIKFPGVLKVCPDRSFMKIRFENNLILKNRKKVINLL